MRGYHQIADRLITKFTGYLTDGKEIIVQAVPVFKDGEVKGVLASTRSIASYTDILSVYSFGGQGYNVIVRSNGDKVINANHETAIENFTNIV